MGAGLAYLRGDSGAAMSALFGAAKNAFSEQRAHEKTKADKTSPADVIMFSGCKDDQTVRFDLSIASVCGGKD